MSLKSLCVVPEHFQLHCPALLFKKSRRFTFAHSRSSPVRSGNVPLYFHRLGQNVLKEVLGPFKKVEAPLWKKPQTRTPLQVKVVPSIENVSIISKQSHYLPGYTNATLCRYAHTTKVVSGEANYKCFGISKQLKLNRRKWRISHY